MEIYSLFGFQFARNSAAQAEMPFEGYDIEGLADEEKKEILDKIPIGSLLYFKGHIMLYLGKVGEEYYVISETARFLLNEKVEGNKLQESTDNIISAHSCMITPLSVKRPNGNTWLEELRMIRCIR